MAHRIMKRLRGLTALVVALAAVLAIGPVAAFADGLTGSVTVKGLQSGDTVYAYKIVDTTINSETNQVKSDFTESVKTALDGKLSFDDYTAAGADNESNAYTIAAAIGADYSDTPYSATALSDGSVQLTELPLGQYLLVVANDNDSTRVYQDTIISVNPVANGNEWGVEIDSVNGSQADGITLKYTDLNDGDNAALHKTINGQDDVSDTTEGGKRADFVITAAIPQYISGAQDRVYKLTDVMDSHFTDASAYKLTINGEVLNLGTDYTVSGNTITLSPSTLSTYGGQTLTVSYSATLSNDAIYSKAYENMVSLEFSIRSYGNETDTISDTVYAVVHGVQFKKVNESGRALQGAEFKVQDASDDSVVGTGVSSNDGTVTINGALASGVAYKLVETKAPNGYQLPDSPVLTFVLGDNAATEGEATSYAAEINVLGGVYSGSLVTIGKDGEIVNKAVDLSSILPTTGGAGTVAFTAAGVVIMAGAVAFIARSRKDNE